MIKTYKCLTSEKLQGVLIGGSQQLTTYTRRERTCSDTSGTVLGTFTLCTQMLCTHGGIRIYLILIHLSFLLTSGISQLPSLLCVISPLPFMFQSWHLSVVTGLALGEPVHVRLRCELMVISFFSPRSLLTNSWPWGCSASTLTWPPTISWCPIGRPCTTLWR